MPPLDTALPNVLRDGVAVLALVALLVTAVRHPRARTEATVGVAAAAVALATGLVGPQRLMQVIGDLGPVVGFLVTILVVAEVCARSGVFDWAAHVAVRATGGRPRALFTAVFVLAAAVTVALSLDATVVLLTPVVVTAALALGDAHRPGAFACLRMANSASLLLPVSNLTNLLAMTALPLTFFGFAAAMLPVWLAVLVVEYAGLRLLHADELSPAEPGQPPEPGPWPRPPWVPIVGVAVMLVCFGVVSPLGVDPFWVSGAAALLLGGWAHRAGLASWSHLARSAHAGFAILVMSLGIVVAALSAGFLGDLVALVTPTGDGFWSLLGIAVLATVLSALVTNLSATLLLLPAVGPLGTASVLAALIGLNVGAGLTWTGSLANLLWRRTLTRQGQPPGHRDFHQVSMSLTPLSLVVACGVLALTV